MYEKINPYSGKYDCTGCPICPINGSMFCSDKSCKLRVYGECPASVGWDQGFKVASDDIDFITEDAEVNKDIMLNEIECLNYEVTNLSAQNQELKEQIIDLNEELHQIEERYKKVIEELEDDLKNMRGNTGGFWG